MASKLVEIFNDNFLILKIKDKLPYMFQIAELQSSRAGKVGMEVGSLREKILISLLIYVFGLENVQTEIPITEPEVDVKLFSQPNSIKTVASTQTPTFKLIWTVDSQKSREFLESYIPTCDIFLAYVNWNSFGALYHIPIEVQLSTLKEIGRENYIKLPKQATNPRGVEISKGALKEMLDNKDTKRLISSGRKRRFNIIFTCSG